MSRSCLARFQSIARRLRYIDLALWNDSRDDQSEEAKELRSTIYELQKQLKAWYGPQIADELFWKECPK